MHSMRSKNSLVTCRLFLQGKLLLKWCAELVCESPCVVPGPHLGSQGLGSSFLGCLPAEMLVVVPLACVIGEDFQDSGSDSRNLPVCWQIYWPGLESLGWEKTGWKGGWWLPAILIFLPIGAPPAEAVQMSCFLDDRKLGGRQHFVFISDTFRIETNTQYWVLGILGILGKTP